MGRQREIREAAMQLLFAAELHGELRPEDTAAFWTLHSAREPVKKGAEELAKAIMENLPQTDEAISGALQNFSFDRLNNVDRNVLRLSVYELFHKPDVPVRVVINEGIEIARRYATEDSAKFVNGVLDRIAKTARAETKAPITKQDS
jgi:N utilization substance protein B